MVLEKCVGLSKRWLWVAVCVLVAIQAVHMVVVVHRESLTFDEADHMFAGYMMWFPNCKTGNSRSKPTCQAVTGTLATMEPAGASSSA